MSSTEEEELPDPLICGFVASALMTRISFLKTSQNPWRQGLDTIVGLDLRGRCVGGRQSVFITWATTYPARILRITSGSRARR
jgi:hypothetical protein